MITYLMMDLNTVTNEERKYPNKASCIHTGIISKVLIRFQFDLLQ